MQNDVATVGKGGNGGCCLCNDISAPQAEFWNIPLFETEDFTVIPSLGALVEGWLLVVPKRHALSSGALSGNLADKLFSLTRKVRDIVLATYGSACIFEHGAVASGRAVGCGVDHAHIHVAPVGFDLAAAASPLLPLGSGWREAKMPDAAQSAFRRRADYLYVEQDGRAQIAEASDFGSQLFRRAIAAKLGSSAEYNWREFPQISTVALTVDKLQSTSFGEQLRRERPAA